MGNRMRIALAVILILLGTALLVQRMGWLQGWEAPFWTIALACTGIVFVILALGGPDYWWSIIPACVFLAVAALLYVLEHNLLPDDVAVAGFLFFGISLPFWLILLIRGRSFWWAAIPGGVLAFVAASVGLATVAEEWVGSMIMWGIAITFWIVYITDRERWWALIPAGIMTSFGALPLVAERLDPMLIASLVFGSVAATFLLIFLLSGLKREFRWTLWPAGVCVVLALSFPLIGDWYDLIWPTLLIVGGLAMLVRLLRRR
jgi:hypothetical protein